MSQASSSPGEGPSSEAAAISEAEAASGSFGRLHCQVLRLITNVEGGSLEAGRLRLLDLRTNIEVSRPSVLCCFQENKSPHDTVDLTDLNIKGRCMVGEQDRLLVDLNNFGPRRLTPGSENNTVSVLAFALPLDRVPVSGLHLFQSQRRGGEENRPRMEARAIIRRTAHHWAVRLTVTPNWRRRTDSSLEAGQIFVSQFAFRAGAIPLTLVDALEQLACSDPNTYIHKTETDERGQWIMLFLHHDSPHPPTSVFLHFSVYTHRAEVVARHNPYPHLRRLPDNGFQLLIPKSFTLTRIHPEYIVQIQNAFETNQTHDTIFFPENIPGVSIEAGPLPDRVRITLRVTLTGDQAVHLEHRQPLGRIHFFRRGFWTLTPGKPDKIKRPQVQLRAGLFPRSNVMRGAVSEFLPQSPGLPPTEEEEEEEEEDDEDDLSSTPTPTPLSEAMFAGFEEASGDEDSDTQAGLSRALILTGQRRRSGNNGALTLVIPSWHVFASLDDLVPLTVSVQHAALRPTSYLRSDMDGDVRTAADISSTLRSVPAPRPSPISTASTSSTPRSRPRI